ncbi:MAG: putative sulfate/molybdate transporter [Verrucomicrobiota bacterium]
MTDQGKIRFDRNELAGAFGDIGTDLPLLIGMILAAGLDSASVLTIYGLMQIGTALFYRLPMPVQPLKAVAVMVITQKLNGNLIYGAGLAIGITMLLLSRTGLIDWIARIVPKTVIRGIQFGLGLQLASLALKDYVRAEAALGYWLATITFVLALLLLGHRRLPAALLVILAGVLYAFAFKLDWSNVTQSIGFKLPQFRVPRLTDIWAGFILLALPQIPLSIGNSILATVQITKDLFPERSLSVRRIGFTYALMNVVNPVFGGIPTCHGSGGMAGHYTFGARTGGSVIIYGMLYLVFGLCFSRGFAQLVQVFPLPILGVILLFEGLALLLLARDQASCRQDFTIVLLVGLAACFLPYGYLIGLVGGTLVHHLMSRYTPQGLKLP